MLTHRAPQLVFPIGHYMGPFYPARNAPARHFVVRVGWESLKLPDDAHRNIWFLAHGVPGQDENPWTRAAVVEAARAAGIPNAQSIIENLLGLGLLALSPASADQAIEFAKSYRIQSLLVGVVSTARDGSRLDAIGLPGLPPLLTVRPSDFEIWQWGHLWPSIWSACEGLAHLAQEAGQVDRSTTESKEVLASMLVGLRTLIARNAIYLDRTIL